MRIKRVPRTRYIYLDLAPNRRIRYPRWEVSPKQSLKGWGNHTELAYVSSLSDGRICIYKSTQQGESGYMVMSGLDELHEKFNAKKLNP